MNLNHDLDFDLREWDFEQLVPDRVRHIPRLSEWSDAHEGEGASEEDNAT